MWPFSRASFLDAEDEQWQCETWAYFLRQCGGIPGLQRSLLVTPTKDFFPPSDLTGHARAEHIFACVKRHAGMMDWPCELIEQPRGPDRHVSEFVYLKPITKGLPLGTFSISGNQAQITYDPDSVKNPLTLVATLAHELAHYRLRALHEDLPGGEETHEFATDLMTVYMGFGVFGANGAFNFRQHQDFMGQGWRMSRQGYLPERAWIFALAVFLELRGQSSDDVKPFLKPHLFTDLRTARAYLAKNDLFRSLAMISNPAPP